MLAALSSSTKMIEVVILAIVIILLATVLVLYRRQSRPAKGGSHVATPASAASYYSDLGTVQVQAGVGPVGGQPSDPFAGFGGTTATAPPVSSPPPPPPPPPVPQGPTPGTPAGWLPDPSGAPDTLRYWDGTNWTQHVATRS
jgi:hypothetical protein